MTDCQKCGKCCTEHLILLTFQDIWEIKTHFPTRNLNQIISLNKIDADYPDKALLESLFDPILLLNERNQLESYYLALKFHSVPNGLSTCHFFNPFTNGCRIHDHKPLTCQAYPFILLQNQLTLEFHGRCPIIQELNFEFTKKKIILLKQANQDRKQFRIEIEEWESNFLNEKHNTQHLFEYIMKIRKSHPRFPSNLVEY